MQLLVLLVLRTISKSKWYRTQGVYWLSEGALQADVLNDLRTKGNKLSVWHIDVDRSNLQQAIVALAANRDYITNLDYVLLEESTLSALDIRIEDSPGETPDDGANNWHCEIVELSLEKLMQLVEVIKEADHERVTEKKIRKQLLKALDSRRISLDKMNASMASSIVKMRQRK